MSRQQLKQPLGQVQERFDIKGGMSREMLGSHLNKPNTWWTTNNFRFYKQNIFTFLRKSVYSVAVPTAQTLTIPSQTCSVNTTPINIPFGMWGDQAGGGPGGFVGGLPIIMSDTIEVLVGASVSYQIKTQYPVISYDATDLPSGLSIDPVSGVISGTLTDGAPTTYTVHIFGRNVNGQSEGTLTIQALGYISVNFSTLNRHTSGVSFANPIFKVSIDGAFPITIVQGVTYNATKSFEFDWSALTHDFLGTFEQSQNNADISFVGSPLISTSSNVVQQAAGSVATVDLLSYGWRDEFDLNNFGVTTPYNQTTNAIGTALQTTTMVIQPQLSTSGVAGDISIKMNIYFTVS